MTVRGFSIGAVLLAVLAGSGASAQTYSIVTNFDATVGLGPQTIVQDASGYFYTPTDAGGLNAKLCQFPHTSPRTNTCGTLARIDGSGAVVDLIKFDGTHGGNPYAAILAGNTLYGSTLDGGAANVGLVYSINTNRTGFRILHQFSGADGKSPGALAFGPNHALYGVTWYGGTGAAPDGVLFEIASDGTFSVLHNFADDPDQGCVPSSIVLGPGGVLYGAIQCGSASGNGGEVFSDNPATGQYTILSTFSSDNGGAYDPVVGAVGADGTIYAAATHGGPRGCGSLFAIGPSTPATVRTLYTFQCRADGGLPMSGPVLTSGGALIGTASGLTRTSGALYRFDSAGFTVLHTFAANNDGNDPVSQPLVMPSGTIVGTTYGGGTDTSVNVNGTLFTYVP